MTSEPLKNKLSASEGFYKTDYAPGYIQYANYFKPNDVKSAVEGCLEEILQEIKEQLDDREYFEDKFKSILKKWFEDVM